MASFAEIMVPSRLGRLKLHVAGQGSTLLFWPSLLMDGSMWLDIAERFADRYRVVLIDPPGHGDSEPLDRGFDFTSCADCVLDILDALQLERAHFIGNSWGAMIGGTFAARHPARLGVAVLMNGTATPCNSRQRLEFTALIWLGRLLRGIRGPLVTRAVRAFLGPTSLRERPQAVAAVRAALARVDFRSVRWAVDSVVPRRPDQRSLFASIHTPVLVIAGAEDPTFPVAETREMAEAIPDAHFTVMPGVAHLAGLECPHEVYLIIAQFIQAYEQKPGSECSFSN